ncbi:MAG: AsmA family protein [Rhodocyclaceae bacterium]|nr:AsmA family protein [Rhodocyclaceae bacterium]
MNFSRVTKWVFASALALIALSLLAAGAVAGFGGNWLRAPVQHATLEKTGRALKLDGDVRLALSWPLLQVHAAKVAFANPAWAKQAPSMLAADEVDLAVDLPKLLVGRFAVDALTLRNADISLEVDAEGRKNWLLDLKQKDQSATVPIGRLALLGSRVAYREPARKTAIDAEVSSSDGGSELVFDARGRYLGMPLQAQGSGGSLLALRDESRPYPFKLEATIGPTHARAAGSVTGLSRISALDASVAANGGSLSQLFPLLGIALPETPAYRTAGRVVHQDETWRYEKLSAHVGSSDLTGTLQVDTAGKRPAMSGELVFGLLDVADLGPTIGTSGVADTDASPSEPARRAGDRVLPSVPFNAERWGSVDADIRLSATRIVRPHGLPLERFATHLQLRDSVLTLDPLEFGLAGGRLAGAVTLDGRQKAIDARAKVKANNIALDRLVPGFDTTKVDAGRVDGAVDLAGKGASLAQMLGTADGTAAVLVDGGHVSRLVMEMVGLHLPEIIALKAGHDQRVAIRCAAAQFRVDDGVMTTQGAFFDTAVTTIDASGQINLGDETLNLTLLPRTKETSLVSLHGPVHIRGSFAKPDVQLEKGRIAARGIGAVALAIANPLLALIPLVDEGPGQNSDCGRLLAQAKAAGPTASQGAPARGKPDGKGN